MPAPYTSPARPPVGGFAIVLVAASMFGMLGTLSRFAYDAGMEPLPFVAWRAAVGMLGTAAFVAWRISTGAERLTRPRDLDRQARLTLAVAALVGFTLNLAMFIAFDLVTVALVLLGFYTYPVMVAAANVALGRETLDRPRVIALALAIAGMVAVVASQLDPSSGIRFDAIGFALALGAALSQTVFVVISKTGYRKVPASQAMGVVLATTVVCCLAVTVLSGAGAALAYPLREPTLLPLLVFTGLFAAAIPSIMFLTGIRSIGGTRAGILMLLEPVVGVALAAWLLGEHLAPIQIVGGLAILGAALILQRSAPPGGRAVAAPAIEADEAPRAETPVAGAVSVAAGAVSVAAGAAGAVSVAPAIEADEAPGAEAVVVSAGAVAPVSVASVAPVSVVSASVVSGAVEPSVEPGGERLLDPAP